MDKVQRVYLALLVVCALLGIAAAGGLYGDHDYYAIPKYAYRYGVNDKYTGDFKTAHEERDGAITRGSYSVLQPDGILRTVKYTVDPVNGFTATVINSGVGIHGKGLIL